MMGEKHIKYEHTAPYYRLNEFTQTTKRIWVVFHGYGQLARFFIRKFAVLNPSENVIIAPQGLSKYYLEGFSGRVGANWMTKEDRLNDIENQYAYLDRVFEEEKIDATSLELVYFGFSQGVATMCRYAAYSRRTFGQMIVWAGTIPPELDAIDFDFMSGSEKVTYYTGKDDPFYESGMEERQLSRIKEVMNVSAEAIWFEGRHEVLPELLSNI